MTLWFCDSCGQQTLRKAGRRHVWCSTCKRLSHADSDTMAWYAAELAWALAGRKPVISPDFCP
jgi:hypothetical protein